MDKKRIKVIVYLLASIAFITVGAFYVFFQGSVLEAKEDEKETEADVSFTTSVVLFETIPDEDPSSFTIFVHVCGNVNEPGVYELPEGSRVYEAVAAAGGVSPEGFTDALNMAEVLSDGKKIYVPSVTEYENNALSQFGSDYSVSESDGRININTADVATLMTLPGIGESRAKAIVAYREKNGAFLAVEDIMKVSGIKEGAFEKIVDLIKIK